MENYILLYSSIGSIFMGLGLTFDYNPSLCISLRVKFNVSKKSILRKVYPGKETRLHPYSYLRILPLAISCILSMVVIPIYVVYLFFNVNIINEWVESKLFFVVGTIVLLMCFIYPLFLMLLNYIFKLREELMSIEDKKKLYKKHEDYYKDIGNF
ncbi:MAG: hypothetical protein WC154_04840 [Candidatus Izemoplasmatales bacterium]